MDIAKLASAIGSEVDSLKKLEDDGYQITERRSKILYRAILLRSSLDDSVATVLQDNPQLMFSPAIQILQRISDILDSLSIGCIIGKSDMFEEFLARVTLVVGDLENLTPPTEESINEFLKEGDGDGHEVNGGGDEEAQRVDADSGDSGEGSGGPALP